MGDKTIMYVCSECGGHDVEISLPAWHNAQTLEYVATDCEADPMYYFCNGCESTEPLDRVSPRGGE